MPDATAILVLGMHRSGTSALAGVLHLLGADMPDDLMTPDKFNEKGYWESRAVAHFNDDIFKSAGTKWDHVGRFPADWYDKPVAAEFRRRGVELLQKRFGDSRLFVLKDPRTSILVPFWLSVLKEMNVRPVVAITTRHPREVADSLAHREDFPPAKSMLLWLIHVLESERSTRGLPRCFLAYDQLLQDWQRCAERIGQTMGFPWPTAFDAAREKIEAMLSKDLRHHRAAADATLPEWMNRAYAALLSAGNGDESNLAQTLGEIDKSLDPALAAFGPLINLEPDRGRSPDKSAENRQLRLQLERVRREQETARAERAAIARVAAAGSCGSIIGLDQLVPVSGASRSSDGSWHGNSGLPRFIAGVTLPAGKLRIRATIRSSAWSRAVICLDNGRGFLDTESFELAPLAPGENRIDRVIPVYLPASLIRIDPTQDPGEWALLAFAAEPATHTIAATRRSLAAKIKAAFH